MRRAKPRNRPELALRCLWLLALCLSGCLRERNLDDPYDRPTTNTAYSVRGVQGQVSVGGSRTEELGARVGATVGVGEHAHVQLNAAHLAFGVANVGAKVTALERGPVALAVGVTSLTARPSWMWFLSKTIREPLSDLTLVNIPVAVTTTWQPAPPLLLGVSAGYEHSAIFGTVDTDAIVFDGMLGARRLWLRPTVHWLIGRVLVEATALVPYAAWGLTDADATVVVTPGVRVGVRTREWQSVPATPGLLWQLATEARVGTTRLRVGVSANPVLRELGVPLTPYLGAAWGR